MKFKRIQASLINHEDQEPSVYMALCLAEALFADIEEAGGTELAQCALGSETAASRLIWLCNQIQEVVRNHDEDLQRNRARLDKKVQDLEKTRGELKTLAAVSEQLAALETEHAELQRRLRDQQTRAQEKTRLAAQCEAARRELEALSQFDPAQARAEQEALKAEIARMAAARQELDDTRAEYDRVRESWGQMTLDIARQKEETASIRKRWDSRQADLAGEKEKKRRLDEDLNQVLTALEALQREVRQLEDRIPETQRLKDEEQRRRDDLQARIDQAEADRADLTDKAADLELALTGLEEKVRTARAAYNDLAASSAAQSQELETLERQIEELRSSGDDRKRETYRRQLEETKQQLEQLRKDCDAIEQENRSLQASVQTKQNERERLLELKQRRATAEEQEKASLRDLEFAASPRYLQEVTALEERVKLLLRVQDRLKHTVDGMRQILGKCPMLEGAVLEEQVSYDLRDLHDHVEKLRNAFLACARQLELEER